MDTAPLCIRGIGVFGTKMLVYYRRSTWYNSEVEGPIGVGTCMWHSARRAHILSSIYCRKIHAHTNNDTLSDNAKWIHTQHNAAEQRTTETGDTYVLYVYYVADIHTFLERSIQLSILETKMNENKKKKICE